MTRVLAPALLVLALRFLVAKGAGWTYEGEKHGDHPWSSTYKTCSGTRQSPINIQPALAKHDMNLGAFKFTNFDNINGVKWTLTNNGHTAQVTYETLNNAVRMSGGGLSDEYIVAQFHLHWGSLDTVGSEHTIDMKYYPMELHIVTFKSSYANLTNALNHPDGLAVLGFFFEIADENPTFAKLVKSLPNVIQPDTAIPMSPFPLAELFPANTNDYYRYLGGLTTPPCLEVVIWTVFRDTIKVSAQQLAAFRNLFSSEADETGNKKRLEDNYRPVQKRSSDIVSASFHDDMNSFATIKCSSRLLFTNSILLSCLWSLSHL